MLLNKLWRLLDSANSHYEKFADGTVKCIDDEIPFEIPQSWCWVRLGSIIDFSKSNSVKPNEIAPDAWILDLEDIEKDTGVLLAKKRMKDIQSKSDKHIFYSGNVLYSKLRPYLNKVIIADENGYCTSEILAFDFGMILNKYAQIYLMSPYFVDYAMSDAYGVKMPRLGSKQGNNALMPLPPFKEQVRIAEQLAKIAPIVNRYASSQSELDRLNAELFEKLKKSVLQEAIQGKLVPQCPNDEPASVLLERIRAEKAKLFKEGKLKKKDLVDSVIFKGEDNKYYEKVGSQVSCIDEEIPFEIPANWEWVRLGTLYQHNTGKALNGANQKGVAYEYITTSNLYWNYFVLDKLRSMPFTDEELEKCTVKKGDLLVCEGGDIGRSAIWNFDYDIRIQNHIHRLRAYTPICTMFVYYTLYLYKHTGLIGGKGIGIQGLSSNALHKLLLPLPSIAEQKRIVDKIEFVITSIMR